MTKTTQSLAKTAWALFGGTNLVLLLTEPVLPFWLTLGVWALSLVALVLLLFLYRRQLAQWRVLLLCWPAYIVCRWLAVQLSTSDVFFTHNLSEFFLIQTLSVILTGLFAVTALALRRDVSVAYIVLPFAIEPLVFRTLILSSGSVLNYFTSQVTTQNPTSLNLLEPLFPAFSCMTILGFLAFIPHLLRLSIREARGN